MKKINIAKDFSKFPSGRYRADGDFSGERLREEFLLPALKSNDIVEIELDGVNGYASSFLEEAFGGLGHYINKIRFISNNNVLVYSINEYLKTYIPSRITIDDDVYEWTAQEISNLDGSIYIYFDCSRNGVTPMFHIITKRTKEEVIFRIIGITTANYPEYYGSDLYNTIDETVKKHRILSIGLDYAKNYLEKKCL